MDAIILDVGGVLLVPHAEPIAELLKLPISADNAERAHYHGAVALDASAADESVERRAYLAAYARAVGVPEREVGKAVPLMQELWNSSSLELWRQPVRGSREALQSLSSRGHKMAIVSNADGTVEEQLRRWQICQVGEGLGVPVLAIIDSTVVKAWKPAAEIFRHAIEPLGVSPGNAIYVGDTVRYDVAGARAAGLQPVHFDPYRLCPARDDHAHVASLAEL
jgi:putative hydrolase of the HAD superfamily